MPNCSLSTMRNDNADSCHKPLEIRSIGKLPMQTFGKDVLHRLKPPECHQKNSAVTNKKIEISNVSRTVFSDNTIKPSKSNEELQPGDIPLLNEKNVKMFSSILMKDIHEKLNIMKSNSDDSRITGGGSPLCTSNENKLTKDSPTKINEQKSNKLTRKNSVDVNVTPKVSFKTKNVSKRPTVITKVVNPRVSDLMLKFNEIIKEKDTDTIEDKIKVNLRNSSKSVQKINIKNEKEPPKSESIVHIRKSIIESRECNKINSPTKKNINLELSNKSNKTNSPLLHKKLSKIKSDPKKQNSFKKKSGSDYCTRNELIYNTHISKLDNPEKVEIIELRTKHKNSAKRKPSFKTSPTRHYSGIVHATIQKFESVDGSYVSRSSTQDDLRASNSKPKIPEKRCNILKTKNLVVRDGRPKIKVIKTNIIEKKKEELKSVNKPKEIGSKIQNISANLNIVDIKNSLKSISQEKKSDTVTKKAIDNDTKITNLPSESKCDIDKLKTISKMAIDNNTKATKEQLPSNKCDINEPQSVVRIIADNDTKTTKELPVESKSGKRNITDKDINKTDKIEKKTMLYEKVSFRNKLNNEKFTLPVNDNVGLKIFNDNNCDENKESQVSDCVLEIKSKADCEKSAEEKYYEDVSLRIKPNESFLWRANSQERIKRHCISISADSKELINVYDVPKPLHLTTSTFDIFQKELNEIFAEQSESKLDELLNSDDESPTTVVEAINESVVNNTNVINNPSMDDDYEPLEPYVSVETKKTIIQVHSKANCPLPEVPKQSTENIYQCLFDVQSSMEDSSGHNYEYCHEKIEPCNDSEDDYEYCKSPAKSSNKDVLCDKDNVYERRLSVSKSSSITSSVGYEKISSIYEKIHSKMSSLNSSPEKVLNYDDCEENIYDTIKPSDTTSISNCYESIIDSPNYNLKMRQKEIAKEVMRMLPNRQLQYDSISTFSQSTISSDQKSNSIYSQRYAPGLEKGNSMFYDKCPSEISFSDRSDEWEDISDQEKSETDTTIIVVREKSKGRHSPASWSRKVRHQWNEAAKSSSPNTDDSSDGEHLYEPLSHATTTQNDRFEEDEDSFDSESESEKSFVHVQNTKSENMDEIVHPQLPDPPPSSNIYTLTRFATAAGKKMKQLKHNLTKSTRKKLESNKEPSPEPKAAPLFTLTKQKKSSSSIETAPNTNIQNIYQNIVLTPLKKDEPKLSTESKIDVNRLSQVLTNIDVLKTNGVNANDNQTLAASKLKEEKESRRKSMSFKSKFKIPMSLANSQKLSPLLPNLPNSTFYLNAPEYTDSSTIDDSQFANESKESVIENQLVIERKKDDVVSIINKENVRKSLSPSIKRYSKISLRPNEPPPPPPDDPKKSKKDKKNNTSSWYDECGLFKVSEPYKPETNGKIRDRTSSASWYTEIGLYQSSNISTSSGTSSTMSGSGTCSTTTAFSSPSTPTPPIGVFNQEPLYQFYDAAKLESVCRDLGNEYDSDNYEDISNYDDFELPRLPPAMSLISPTKGPSRTLWCEIPEVINSSYYKSLSPIEKKLQEAKFEIVTSEASYLNSLSVLESQYINNAAFQDEKILSKEDKQILFGNIHPIKRSSERFMADLESCWQTSIRLEGLCRIIKNHANKYFHIYINYCENQIHLVKTLKKLKSDTKFNEIINYLQCQPACQSLSLDSFVMLPMQRITRLPLLVDAVLKYLETDNKEYELCLDTLKALNNVVCECNEAARNFERIEELGIVASKIEFPSHIQEIQINSLNEQNKKVPYRWLIRSGEVNQLVWRIDDQSKLTFGRKMSKVQLHLFLFTDILIVTKKKIGEDIYTVVDYCNRSLIETTLSDMMAQSPVKDSARKFIVLLTMLENHENKTVEMLLSFADETDRQRWIEAFPPTSFNADEKIYEVWDCPQVVSLYHYQSEQPDELSLQPGDVINVDKKMANGWYHGQRIRDDESGWFPGNYTKEIASAHVRARNLRQRYRLLELSGSYLAKERRKIV